MKRTPPVLTSTTESLVTAIVEEVADREGVKPAELEPSFCDLFDPRVLDTLFAPTEGGAPRDAGRVRFAYCGYEVVVRSDGDVSVEGEKEPIAEPVRI